jgi:hypothetical protein
MAPKEMKRKGCAQVEETRNTFFIDVRKTDTMLGGGR